MFLKEDFCTIMYIRDTREYLPIDIVILFTKEYVQTTSEKSLKKIL